MSFTKDLLKFIYETGELLPGIESPYDYARRLRRSTYYGAVYRLERRGLIAKKTKAGVISYTITDKGKLLVGQKFAAKKRTDGFSTLVLFDIPESKRKARNLFRKYLMINGFIPMQKSAYISRNKIPKTIIAVAKELGLSANVSVIGGKVEYYL
jgi:DNA-binding transcriptional regulator PaaX